MLKKVSTTLFDNRAAKLKIYAETLMIRTTNAGNQSEKPLYYYSAKYGTLYANSNTYLMFETRDSDDYYTNRKVVRMSYAHMYWLKNIFESVKDILLDDEAWINTDGVLYVNEDEKYGQSFTIDEIGKNNDWISFRLTPIDLNGETVKGVKVSLLSPENYSILTIDEFLYIYQIIKDFKLFDLQIAHMQMAYSLTQENYDYMFPAAPMVQNTNYVKNSTPTNSHYNSNQYRQNNYSSQPNRYDSNKKQNEYQPPERKPVAEHKEVVVQNNSQKLTEREDQSVKAVPQNTGNHQADTVLNSGTINDDSKLFDDIMNKER